MAERKVVNKYYPPDFDPSKIPRRKIPKQTNVRTMLSISIRCTTCGNYIYKGTKVSSRKEETGETYLGIEIYRFYFTCTNCSAEITIKTDPQNSDYVVESGATRNYEPQHVEDEVKFYMPDVVEIGDAMKSLQNRTRDSKREMDRLSKLDELKSLKSRHADVSTEKMLSRLKQSAPIQEEKLKEEHEALIKSVYQASRQVVKRIDDAELDDDITLCKKMKVSQQACPTDYLTNAVGSSKRDDQRSTTSFVLVKKSSTSAKTKVNEEQQEENAKITSNGLQSLCQQYDSDEDEQ